MDRSKAMKAALREIRMKNALKENEEEVAKQAQGQAPEVEDAAPKLDEYMEDYYNQGSPIRKAIKGLLGK